MKANVDKGLLAFLIFLFLLFVSLIVVASIALVKSNDAKYLIDNLVSNPTTLPNLFPLTPTTPQICYGSFTIPLYTRNFTDQYNIYLQSRRPDSGFCEWTGANGLFQCDNNQASENSTFRVSRLATPPANPFMKTPITQLGQQSSLLVNGQWTEIQPALPDDKTTTFKDSKVQAWSPSDATISIFGKQAKTSDWGNAPFAYVILGVGQKVSQTFTVQEACGYKCSLVMNALANVGGSATLRILDNAKQIRAQTLLRFNTNIPGSLVFEWTYQELILFLNPGTYSVEISGETQSADQQFAFTDISILPFLNNQFTIELPLPYKTIPFVQCTLVSDATKQISDYIKSTFVQQYQDTCVLETGYANYFVSAVTINNTSFFTVDILGPVKNLDDVCAVQLTINWMAIGLPS